MSRRMRSGRPFLDALIAERFGPATPPPPRPNRASAVAIAELLADLNPTDDKPTEGAA